MDYWNQKDYSPTRQLHRGGGRSSGVMRIVRTFNLALVPVLLAGLCEAQTLASAECPAGWIRLTEPTLSFCHPGDWVREPSQGPDGSRAIVIKAPGGGGFILSYLDIAVADSGKDSEQLARRAYERVFGRTDNTPYPLLYKLGGQRASLVTRDVRRMIGFYKRGAPTMIAFSMVSPPIMSGPGQAFGRMREIAEKTFRFELSDASMPATVDSSPLFGSWGWRAAIYLQKVFLGDIDHRIEFLASGTYRYDARLFDREDGRIIQDYSYVGTYRLDPRPSNSDEWAGLLVLTPRSGGATPLLEDGIRYNGWPDNREREFHLRWKEFPFNGEQRIRLELRGTDSTQTWYLPRLTK